VYPSKGREGNSGRAGEKRSKGVEKDDAIVVVVGGRELFFFCLKETKGIRAR
jgi:hypothetical protein